jgi:hypothetical protein
MSLIGRMLTGERQDRGPRYSSRPRVLGCFTCLAIIAAVVGAFAFRSPSPSINTPVLAASSAGSSVGLSTGLSIKVHGNTLVDGSGNPVVLRGVDRSSSEYECVGNASTLFNGPDDQASVDAMLKWHINVVRVPLNEACWLDVTAALGGAQNLVGPAYRQAIVNYVNLLNANGIYAILDDHWGPCGGAPDSPNPADKHDCEANWQKPMPDRPYATAFWASVARSFAGNHAVLFDLFNEPDWNDWSCWANGGCDIFSGNLDNEYTAEGMAEMIQAIRGAGSNQPVMLGGLSFANDMSGWLANLPTDPARQLVASVHFYNFNYPCATTACFDSGPYALTAIAQKYPVVFGEMGENDCGTSFIDPVMAWADRHGYSYLGWSWTVADCSSFPSLITAYNGTPTAFGKGLLDHMAGITPPTTTTTTTTTTTVPTSTTTTSLPAVPGVSVDKIFNARGTNTVSLHLTTSSRDLLVAFVASDGYPSGGQTLTVSGGPAWHRVRRSNGQPGDAEVWATGVVGAQPNTTVTAHLAQSGRFDLQLTVVAYKHASKLGDVASASRADGAPSIAVHASRAGALVYAVGDDWDAAIRRVPPSNQTLEKQDLDVNNDTYWIQRLTAHTVGPGMVTIKDTAPTVDCWNMVAVVVLPA